MSWIQNFFYFFVTQVAWKTSSCSRGSLQGPRCNILAPIKVCMHYIELLHYGLQCRSKSEFKQGCWSTRVCGSIVNVDWKTWNCSRTGSLTQDAWVKTRNPNHKTIWDLQQNIYILTHQLRSRQMIWRRFYYIFKSQLTKVMRVKVRNLL